MTVSPMARIERRDSAAVRGHCHVPQHGLVYVEKQSGAGVVWLWMHCHAASAARAWHLSMACRRLNVQVADSQPPVRATKEMMQPYLTDQHAIFGCAHE